MATNLAPHKQRLLNELRENLDFIVFPADKNLGPCIIERDRYIAACLDHLSDTTTYRRLDQEACEKEVAARNLPPSGK